jgi:hypothetical protein
MKNSPSSFDFYTTIIPREDFGDFADADIYTSLPDDWWVGTSDIVGSTQAVAEGRYKTVNMVGAAVVSAQMNAHEGAQFPCIFGGDGAGFAVPPAWKDRAEAALAAVRIWAREEFQMDLRVGLTSVSDIRASGLDITVARFQAAEGLDYAMFAGGGLSWAETQMKSGVQTVPDAAPGTKPDLTGLSCRWSNMPSQHGVILSVVILPQKDAPAAAFAKLAHSVIDLAENLDRSGNPSKKQGPNIGWPTARARSLEAHAQHGNDALGPSRRTALYQSLIAWVLIKTGLKIGGFDAREYRRVVGQNADFRKFDDGLKMTLDCDAATQKKLRGLLEKAAADGLIRYGLHEQSEAMMTCIVPSMLRDDHMHFVDGAAGGYTAAAQAIKG